MGAIDEFLDFLRKVNSHIGDIRKHAEKYDVKDRRRLLRFIDQKRKTLLELLNYIEEKEFNKNRFESLYRSCETALLELIGENLFTFGNEQESVSFFGKLASLKERVIESFITMDNLNMEGNALLSSIKPIEKSRNLIVKERSELEGMVERPLLKACQILYDKNIRTLSTSANAKDTNNGAYIVIEYDSLSQENRRIAETYGDIIDYDGMKAVKIIITFDEKTNIAEVEAKSLEIANSFRSQKMTWVPRYTFEELLSVYRLKKEDGYKPEDFSKDLYYDKKSGLFYLSKEHFIKSQS